MSNKFTDLKVRTKEKVEEKKTTWLPMKTGAFPLSINENITVNIEEDEIFVIRDASDIIPISSVKTNAKRINEYYEGSDMKSSGIKYNDDQKINKKEYAWVRRGNSMFISAKPNTEELPAGLYEIKSSMEQGIFLERRSVILDDLFLPPSDVMGKIVKDIKKFWTSRQKYADYGIIYKRGILTFGKPGCGKTSLFNLLMGTLIDEYNGIVINMDRIDSFIAMAQNIRALEPDRPILAVIEDLDGFLQYNSVQAFLNLLDGNAACDNIVYLGSTNYIDRLEPRVLRSSRFDRKYEIAPPNDETRKFYFEKKLKPEDIEKLGPAGLSKWVADTKGMAFSDLKEIIASVVVMEMGYDEVLIELKKYEETYYNRR